MDFVYASSQRQQPLSNVATLYAVREPRASVCRYKVPVPGKVNPRFRWFYYLFQTESSCSPPPPPRSPLVSPLSLVSRTRYSVREQVRRLITLVDIMYERGVKMVCLAEALPTELFDPGPGRREDMPDEVFAFGRTASRLAEMQGPEYLQRREGLGLGLGVGVTVRVTFRLPRHLRVLL